MIKHHSRSYNSLVHFCLPSAEMTSVNNIPNLAFSQLRPELVECRRELKHFKQLYSNEIKNVKEIKKSGRGLSAGK